MVRLIKRPHLSFCSYLEYPDQSWHGRGWDWDYPDVRCQGSDCGGHVIVVDGDDDEVHFLAWLKRWPSSTLLFCPLLFTDWRSSSRPFALCGWRAARPLFLPFLPWNWSSSSPLQSSRASLSSLESRLHFFFFAWKFSSRVIILVAEEGNSVASLFPLFSSLSKRRQREPSK